MNHKHIDKVPEYIERIPRRAIAPYNFVELPDRVVEAELPLPSGDRYDLNLKTGRIECILTTESPLYIRCGLTTEEFQADREAKDLPDFFYTDPATKSEKPVLPGSSLRGMLRTLVEIISFSKIERVSDEHRLFFRAVASNQNKESWGQEYKKYVEPQKVKAGYLKKDNQGWYIQPAKTEKGETFAWVRETSLSLLDFKLFNDKNYHPQYIPVSYERADIDPNDKAKPKRLFAHNVESPDTHPTKKGLLVTSGNMKQGDESSSSPRHNHCVVFAEDKNAARLQIDDTAIKHYCNALTNFQKESPFNKDWGVLKEKANRPVFYCPPEEGKNIVGFFGQSPNFRIPYSPKGNGHATTVVDFIPEGLRKSASIDLADAIFGWVKKESKDFDKQRAGRVFFTDALYQSNQNGIWYQDKPLTPQILSNPKPSNFPHYLVQPNADKSELKHYASEPITKTVIRGHKLYWHKGSNPDFKLPPPKKVIGSTKKVMINDTQTTLIKPINQGVSFKFDIHFENLSDVELGALLWVLNVAKDDAYRLKLGMGKPLGLGAVKIEPTLYLSNRQKRYEHLFDSNDWEKAESKQDISDYVYKFETYVLEQLNHTGDFNNLCRIQMLLAMLSWPGLKDLQLIRYMEIERDINKPHIGQPVKRNDKTVNEYKERPVLPNPLDVMREVTGIKIECDHLSPSIPEISTTEDTQNFSEDQEIDAKVTDIKEEQVHKKNKTQLRTTITYQIEGSDCSATEEVNKQKVFLNIGNIVKVNIIKAQGTSIKKVKRIQEN